MSTDYSISENDNLEDNNKYFKSDDKIKNFIIFLKLVDKEIKK